MPVFRLHESEMRELDREAVGDGGFQTLARRLQGALNRETGEIKVSDRDVPRLRRYCDSYGEGGWQARLRRAFTRSLDAYDGEND